MFCNDWEKKFQKGIFFSLLVLFVFIPYREILGYLVTSKIKLIPDLIIFILLAIDLLMLKGYKRFKYIDFIYILFLTIGFISTIYNGNKITAFIIETRSISLYYLIYFIVRDRIFDKSFLLLFRKIIIINTVILVFQGIMESISSKLWLFPEEWTYRLLGSTNFNRIYGLFNNPNTFGAYLILGFLTVLYIDNKYKIFNKYSWIFYSICTTGLLLTISRSSILAIALALVLLLKYYIFDRKVKIKLISVIVIGLLSFMLVGVVGMELGKYGFFNKASQAEALLKRFNELGDDEILKRSNEDGRIYSIKKGLSIFKENVVIGTGFGTYGDAASLILGSPIYDKYNIRDNFYADNEYIKVLVQTGILGFLVYLSFLLYIFYNLIKQKDIFRISIFLTILFLGLFYNIFEVQIVSLFFWFWLGNKDNTITTEE